MGERKVRRATLLGPLTVAALVVALCWLGVGAALLMSSRIPLALAFVAVAVVAGLATGLLAWRMIVRVTPSGLRLPGRHTVAWDEIEEVLVVRQSGVIPLQLPTVMVRRGRALEPLELDGLSVVGGPGKAREWALRIAEAADLDEVKLVDGREIVREGGGRRAES